MAKKGKKVFVLDTNVILHDYRSIYNFADNDVVIPIVVLEELDKFKKGNDLIHYHAREFARELDRISNKDFFDEGASLGEGHGRLFIQHGVKFSQRMRDSFSDDTPDHRILSVTEFISKKMEGRPVILVTKDMNLRMKALSLGLQAEDYKTDQVEDLELAINRSVREIDDFDVSLINCIYESAGGVEVEKIFPGQDIKGNNYYVLRNGNASVLACYGCFVESGYSVGGYQWKSRDREDLVGVGCCFASK